MFLDLKVLIELFYNRTFFIGYKFRLLSVWTDSVTESVTNQDIANNHR